MWKMGILTIFLQGRDVVIVSNHTAKSASTCKGCKTSQIVALNSHTIYVKKTKSQLKLFKDTQEKHLIDWTKFYV